MNIETAVTKLAKKRGWIAEVENKGDGNMEIIAFCKADEEMVEFFDGKIQAAAGWARKLPVIEQEPKVEQLPTDEAWEEAYGGMSDADIMDALSPTQEEKDEPEEEDFELPQEEEVEEEAVPQNTQKDEEETVEENSVVKKFKGLFVKAPTTTKADLDLDLPTIVNETVIDDTASYLDVKAVEKKVAAARKGCNMVSLGYISRGGKATTRPVRIVNHIEDRFYAWDLQEYTKNLALLREEAPKGQADIVAKRKALQMAEREFLFRRVTDIDVTDKKLAPVNPGKAIVVRPATADAVATRGNGFPRAVNADVVERLMALGFVLVPTGE